MELCIARPTAAIGIGGGLSVAIDTRCNLLAYNDRTHIGVNLGPLTQQRAKELGEYLQRLAIHTPEK